MPVPRPRAAPKYSGQRRLLRQVCIAAAVAAVALGSFTTSWSHNEASASFLEQKKKRVKELLRGPSKSSSRLIIRYRDYEALLTQKRRQLLPRLLVRKTPPPPVQLGSFGTAVEVPSGGAEALRGFPFTTSNTGSMEIKFPRIDGKLGLSIQDPPAGLDLDESKTSLEVSYSQEIQVLGKVGGKLKSNGEWSASFSRDLEDIGKLSGTADSQLDWTVDLESTYKPIKGFLPTVTYGATQDGMYGCARVSGDIAKNIHGTYVVRNAAGRYAPLDFNHDCEVEIVTSSGRNSLKTHITYDRRQKSPFRPDLTYTGKTNLGEVEATLDPDRYRLCCKLPRAKISASLAREPSGGKGGGGSLLAERPAELELTLGKVKAEARFVPNEKPRIRLSVAR